MTGNYALKSCPECGNSDEISTYETVVPYKKPILYSAICGHCGYHLSCFEMEDVVKIWNRSGKNS